MAVSVVESSQDENRPESAIHLSPSFLAYHPFLSSILAKAFPVIRWEEDQFGNDMPQIVAGEVDHLVMLSIINGDSWTQSLADFFLAGYFKQAGVGGQNVGRLGSLEIFYDQRMDQRGLKYFFINNLLKVLAVKGQGSFTKLMAKFMKHVVDIDYRVRIDGHSHLDFAQSEEEGIDVINITIAFEMLDELIERGVINDDLDNVIAGIDLGNLPLVKAIRDKYGWSLAVMDKERIPVEGSANSSVKSNLIYGDVEGKRVILVDDMISSGFTLEETVREALKHEAAEIIICAAHPVLVGDYYKNLKKLLDNEKVKLIMTTNLIPLQRPFFGRRPTKKSKPYANILNEKNRQTKKELEIFDAFGFVGMIVQVLLNSGGDIDRIKNELAEHMVESVEKVALFKELTGQDYPNGKIDGIYKEGEKIILFDEVDS